MDMTKEILMSYRSKKAEIRELTVMIENRYRDDSLIGNDVILDYSKSYPPIPQGVVGFDQAKYRRLQDRDRRRKEQLEKECAEIEDFIESIEDSLTRRIFRMTFIDGEKQRKVAKAVHLDRSVVSRKINNFLKVAQKTQKTHL